jgi:chromosome segregation ATPase
MMKGSTRALALALTIAGGAALAGCTGTQDPAQAGFFDGAGNLLSGTYDQRVAEREELAARTEADAQQLAGRADELERQRVTLESQEAAARARVQRVNADIQTQQSRLASLRQNQQVNQQELARLQAQADDLDRRMAELRNTPNDPAAAAELAQLERENAELRQVIDQMFETIAVAE